MAAGNLTKLLKYHFQEAEPYYIVFFVALAAGSCAGAFTFGCLNDALVREAAVIFSNYSTMLKRGIDRNDVIYEALKGNCTFGIILYVCSFTPAAVAAGAFLLAVKGFCIGFMVAGFLKCFSIGAAALMVLKSLPCQFFTVTSLLLMSGCGVMYCRKQRTVLKNTMLFIAAFLISIIGIICEVLIKC
ncbi:MAG: hypothetical protein IJZ90_04165 [Clostridia bacterium]|nr:hypothetical protein [Clostridia bacterium]